MSTMEGLEHECRIESDRENGVEVVRVVGALDWATAPQLREYLRQRRPDGVVLLDLTATTHSDSAGVGALLVAAAEASEHGQQLVVVVADAALSGALDAAGLGFVIPMVPTLSEAWGWLGEHGNSGLPALEG
jgi:anti-anti-sigma factor